MTTRLVTVVLTVIYFALQHRVSAMRTLLDSRPALINTETGTLYTPLREIGSGTQSSVTLAIVDGVKNTTQLQLGQQVALKEAHNLLHEDNEGSLRNEFDLLHYLNLGMELESAAIPRVFELFTRGESVYMSMEYIAGKVLDRLPSQRLPTMMFDTLDALALLGKHGISRTDWKPSNFMMDDEGKPKLIDFGLARKVGQPMVGQVDFGGLASNLYYAATGEYPILGCDGVGTNVFDALCRYPHDVTIDIYDVTHVDSNTEQEAWDALLKLDRDIYAIELSAGAAKPFLEKTAWYKHSRLLRGVPDEASNVLNEALEKRSLLGYVLDEFTFLKSLIPELKEIGLVYVEPAHGASCSYEANATFASTFPAVFEEASASWCALINETSILTRYQRDLQVLQAEEQRIRTGLAELHWLGEQGLETTRHLEHLRFPHSTAAWTQMVKTHEEALQLKKPLAAATLVLLGNYFDEDFSGYALTDETLLLHQKNEAQDVVDFDLEESIHQVSARVRSLELLCERRDKRLLRWLGHLLANSAERRFANSTSAVEMQYAQLIDDLRYV